MTGPFTYRIEEAQVVRAMQRMMIARLRTGPGRFFAIAFAVLLPLLVVLETVAFGRMSGTALALLIALPLALLIVHFWLAPMMGRRQFRQSAALRDTNTIAWDETAITFTGSRGQVRLPFAEFYKWRDAGDVLMLFQTEMYFNLVPKAPLGEAAADLMQRLDAAGVKRA